MKVLFQNIMENYKTLTTTNQSLNHVVGNLVHPFLRQRFQSTSTSSIVTFEFEEDQTTDCLFLGYYNATSFIIEFKDSNDVVLKTINLTTVKNLQTLSTFFDTLSGVRKIEITITGPQGVLLGGVGCGICQEIPNLLSVFTRGNTDNSSYEGSLGGQTLQNYMEPLRAYSVSFSGFKDIQIDELYDSMSLVGSGRPLYMDIPNIKAGAIYSKFIAIPNYNIAKVSSNFSLSIEECR